MKIMNADVQPAAGAAWWRHGMVWLVVAGPAVVVVAAVATAVLAWRGADVEMLPAALHAAAGQPGGLSRRPAEEASRHLVSGAGAQARP